MSSANNITDHASLESATVALPSSVHYLYQAEINSSTANNITDQAPSELDREAIQGKWRTPICHFDQLFPSLQPSNLTPL